MILSLMAVAFLSGLIVGNYRSIQLARRAIDRCRQCEEAQQRAIVAQQRAMFEWDRAVELQKFYEQQQLPQ